MSLAELRAELKSLRKSANPVPASRMKKADIAMEIARLKGTTPAESAKPKAEAPKKKEMEAAKEEPKVKKTKGLKAVTEVKVPTTDEAAATKPSKGSEEMRKRMEHLRSLRKAKKEEA